MFIIIVGMGMDQLVKMFNQRKKYLNCSPLKQYVANYLIIFLFFYIYLFLIWFIFHAKLANLINVRF